MRGSERCAPRDPLDRRQRLRPGELVPTSRLVAVVLQHRVQLPQPDPRRRVREHRHDVDLSSRDVGIGSMKIRHDALRIRKCRKLAEVGLLRNLQRGQPECTSATRCVNDELVAAGVGRQHLYDIVGSDDRTVARHDRLGTDGTGARAKRSG
jgi:hypothetical protein